MFASVILLILFVSLLVNVNHCVEECKYKSPCSCSFSNGFKDVSATNDSYKYSYNPCYAFTEDTCGAGTAVCQSDGKSSYYVVGMQDKVTFAVSETNQIVATYKADDEKHTVMTWVCDKNSNKDNLIVIGETKTGSMEYIMTLYSKCACADECITSTPMVQGLSTGSILVIFFFVILCCYLCGGVIFQKIVKGAEGREVIPHYEFWIDFPLLVRDGVVFVLNGCRTEASYERI